MCHQMSLGPYEGDGKGWLVVGLLTTQKLICLHPLSFSALFNAVFGTLSTLPS